MGDGGWRAVKHGGGRDIHRLGLRSYIGKVLVGSRTSKSKKKYEIRPLLTIKVGCRPTKFLNLGTRSDLYRGKGRISYWKNLI